MINTCVSVTFSNFAISDRSLELKYFLISNCFSNSNIWRPVNVVLAFFFFLASWDESSDESSSWQCVIALMPLLDDCVEFCDINRSSWFESIDFFLLNGSFWDVSVKYQIRKISAYKLVLYNNGKWLFYINKLWYCNLK